MSAKYNINQNTK